MPITKAKSYVQLGHSQQITCQRGAICSCDSEYEGIISRVRVCDAIVIEVEDPRTFEIRASLGSETVQCLRGLRGGESWGCMRAQ